MPGCLRTKDLPQDINFRTAKAGEKKETNEENTKSNMNLILGAACAGLSGPAIIYDNHVVNLESISASSSSVQCKTIQHQKAQMVKSDSRAWMMQTRDGIRDCALVYIYPGA